MNSQPTFKAEQVPSAQPVDSPKFVVDTAPLQAHFQKFKDMGMEVCAKLKSDAKGLEALVKATTLAALRVANEHDMKSNHFDYVKASNDSPMDDPIARQKLAGTA